MKNSSIIKVPVPEKGVTKAKSGVNKITYVYYYTNVFRNKDGKPDNKRISIGKYIEEENMLIPNANYYKIFKNENTQDDPIELLEITNILKIGEFILFDKIAKELGLIDIIKNIFTIDADEILTLVMYMLCTNRASMYSEDWCEENYTYANKVTQTSRIYENIDYDKRFLFFKKWVKANNPDEYNAYDITSISSYCTNSELTERGYNRDSENLPQLNLGVIYGEQSELPKYYNCYSGSINDKTYLPFMTEGIDELGMKISKFVLDRGFANANNVDHMVDSGLKFILCVKETSQIKEMVIKNIEDVTGVENYILDYETYAKSYPFDENTFIHIFHSNDKVSNSEKELYAKIALFEKELSKLKTLSNKAAKKYRQYFYIEIFKNKTFVFSKDYSKIKKAHKLLGYFACLTNDEQLTCEKVLEIYRRKDGVEKYFDNHKHFNDGKRLRTHNDKTGQGKTFILFLSLIFKSYIDKTLGVQNKMKLQLGKKVYSVDKMLWELSKIKTITINAKTRILQPVTKKQRDILEWFNISESDVTNFIINNF